MALTPGSRVTLHDGNTMPVLGLGMWQAGSGKQTRKAVATALEIGYRLFDTAKLYGNESDLGTAIRESGIPREEIFVMTKLWNNDQGYESGLRAFEKSRRELGLDYVDLYLIHWPVPGLRQESWKALLKIRDEGLARSIGVSNYTIRHLEELLRATPAPPAVNQVEFHPFLYQKELLEFCVSKKIQLEAYSPLTRGHRLDHPVIAQIAARHGRTPAQVLIRWSLQHGLVVIPKSIRPERIRENAAVFDFQLSPDDMKRLDSLDESSHVAWDPEDLP
ncbi:MAG TPA: aldo/keto reductase [Thermoplasmata archaeon]|nr:aldo/keto reductase [Thermoplasmata archaeon]